MANPINWLNVAAISIFWLAVLWLIAKNMHSNMQTNIQNGVQS
jgi:hypothetical protein